MSLAQHNSQGSLSWSLWGLLKRRAVRFPWCQQPPENSLRFCVSSPLGTQQSPPGTALAGAGCAVKAQRPRRSVPRPSSAMSPDGPGGPVAVPGPVGVGIELLLKSCSLSPPLACFPCRDIPIPFNSTPSFTFPCLPCAGQLCTGVFP